MRSWGGVTNSECGFGRQIIVGALASIIVLTVLFAFMSKGSFVDRSESLELDAVPGISAPALAKKNVTYRIVEPVTFYRKEDIALFDVEILVPGFSQQRLTFTGDGERFNGFVAEIEFVKKNSGRFKPGQAGRGAVDGVTSLITGLWGLVRHPIDSAKEIGNGSVELTKYLYNASAGKADPANDIKNLANSIYVNTASEIASEAHFSYQEVVTEEARRTADAMTNWKLSGRSIMDVALLLVPISKLTAVRANRKIAEIIKVATTLEKAEEIGEAAKGYESIAKAEALFSQSERILNSLCRMARFASVERKIAEQILRPLSDPVKLSTLGLRGANTRVHHLLYHLYDIERNGSDIGCALDRALVPGVKSEFYYSQPLVKQKILENYKNAKDLGIFESMANLDKMRRGYAPIIQRGPYAGKAVEVDHIIPIKEAPELSNNLANLRYLSETENASRGAKIDQDAVKLMQKMKSAGWKPSNEFASKLVLLVPNL